MKTAIADSLFVNGPKARLIMAAFVAAATVAVTRIIPRWRNTLELQVNMRKFDPLTDEVFDDKRVDGELMERNERRPGHGRAE